MSSQEEDASICSWQQIEDLLTKSSEERTDSEIRRVLPWFRERRTIFHTLDVESLSGIVRLANLVCLKADHVVVHQGDVGNCFFLIVRGSVVVHAKKSEVDGENAHIEPVLRDVSTAKGTKERARFGQELCTLRPGRCFGELSVFGSNSERNATIITDEVCVLVCISRETCLRFISEEFAAEIVQRSSFVANHPFFRTWTLPYRHLLEENLQLRHLKYGEKVAKQGEFLEAVYFVLEGQATLRMNPIHLQQQYSHLLSKIKRPVLEEGCFDPFQKLSVIERRRLRRNEGYFACEQRYRELDICTVGSGGIIGDIETVLDLPYYTVTAECTQELKIYEIDKSSFLRIIVKKNPETYEKMRRSVHEKIQYRNSKVAGGIPIYTALLELFQKLKPKDNRKNILKKYHARNAKKTPVKKDYFIEMSQGRTTNRNVTNKSRHVEKREPVEEIIVAEETVVKVKEPKTQLWKTTGRIAGALVSIRKKRQKDEALETQKQFTADEYKDLKKKMQALGKSTRKGDWPK